MDSAGGRLRRDARGERPASLHPAAAAGPGRAAVPDALPRPQAARHDQQNPRQIRAARRRPATGDPQRQAVRDRPEADGARNPPPAPRPPPRAAPRPRPLQPLHQLTAVTQPPRRPLKKPFIPNVPWYPSRLSPLVSRGTPKSGPRGTESPNGRR